MQHFSQWHGQSGFSTLIPGDPHQAAVKLLAAQVQREALVLTFNDIILMMGVLFVVGVILMPLVRNRCVVHGALEQRPGRSQSSTSLRAIESWRRQAEAIVVDMKVT